MSDEIRPEVIKKTQDLLGAYVKKPPLTEKLLKKPPFRFLHDIVTSINKETKFFNDIFTDFELQSDNVKEKEDKIKFLYKLINTMKIVMNSDLSARPSKIVAGHEPVKTNELLQAIGKALQKNLNTKSAVEQMNSGLDLSKDMKFKAKKLTSQDSIQKDTKLKKLSSQESIDKLQKNKKIAQNSTEKLQASKKLSQHSIEKLEKKSSKDLVKKKSVEKLTKYSENVNKISSKSVKDSKLKKQKNSVEELEKTNSMLTSSQPEINLSDIKHEIEKNNKKENEKTEISTQSQNQDQINNAVIKNENIDTEIPTQINVPKNQITEDDPVILNKKSPNIIKTQPNEPTNNLNKGNTKQDEHLNIISENENKPTIKLEGITEQRLIDRQPSARRPRTSLRPPSARPPSARPAAPRIRERSDIILSPEKVTPLGKVNVIVENFDKIDRDDDNENLVIVETISNISEIQPPIISKLNNDDKSSQGHLVAQILETQKELTNDVSNKMPLEIEWEEDSQRNRETKKRYIDNIRTKIQTITRAALPLGQIINFLQEDYDNIIRELQIWRSTNTKLNEEIIQQKNKADHNFEPMKKQFQEVQEEIEKQKQKNNMLKIEMHRNQHKIEQLLTTLKM